MSSAVVNTSPIQYLYQLDQLHILRTLFAFIQVPTAVLNEIEIGRSNRIYLPDLRKLDWVTVSNETDSDERLEFLGTRLGKGESEVLLIMAASIPDSVAVIDDLRARHYAKSMGIRHIGTLGLLIHAKRAGSIDALKPMLEYLRELGFHLSQSTFDLVLELAGEQD